MCGRGGTSRSTPADPHRLRLVEDDTAALRNRGFMGREAGSVRGSAQVTGTRTNLFADFAAGV